MHGFLHTAAGTVLVLLTAYGLSEIIRRGVSLGLRDFFRQTARIELSGRVERVKREAASHDED